MRSIRDFTDRIICGDCVSVMQEMPAESVDFALADPPYLVHYRDRFGRGLAGDDAGQWLKPAMRGIYRVLKRHAYFVCFYGWPKAERFIEAWKAAGFRPAGHLVWVKNYASQQRVVRYQHEAAFVLVKGAPGAPRAIISDVLEWRYTGNRYHPTQKPLVALLPLVLAYSKVGGIVLDPFLGSGTTAVAAAQLGRKYIGIELDPKYCQVARTRVRNEGSVA